VAEPTYREAPTYAGDSYSSILEAKVIDVDLARYTATVKTEGSGRTYPDLPIGSFYAHHERGEGGYCLPDIGAPCWIATPGDAGTPFILAFRSLPRAISSSERVGQPPAEGDEIQADHSMRRPRRLHGEFGWTTRDGAFIHYRKGGIVEIGSKASCQRLFIPLGNFIRDICENYGQFTAAGVQYFDGGRTEGEDGSEAEAKWRLMVKAHAADESASVLVDAGIVKGDAGEKRFRIVVAPTSVKIGEETWEASGEKYHFFVDAEGNIDEKGAIITMEYSELNLTVQGDRQEGVGGDSTEIVTKTKTIAANRIAFSAPAGFNVVGNTTIAGTLGVTGAGSFQELHVTGFFATINLAWLNWLISHKHPINPATPTITDPPIPL